MRVFSDGWTAAIELCFTRLVALIWAAELHDPNSR